MVEFPDQVRESARKTYAVWAAAKGLTEEGRTSKFGRAIRVTAKSVQSGTTWGLLVKGSTRSRLRSRAPNLQRESNNSPLRLRVIAMLLTH